MERVEAHLSDLACRAHSERQSAGQRRAEALQSGQQLVTGRELRGVDFHLTRHWLHHLESERNRALAASAKLLEQHREVLAERVDARRKVRLLETLRQRKHDAHERSAAKELEAQAAEFFLARRIREKKE